MTLVPVATDLRKRRHSLGLTQAEVAAACEPPMTRQVVSKAERTGQVYLRTALAIQAALYRLDADRPPEVVRPMADESFELLAVHSAIRDLGELARELGSPLGVRLAELIRAFVTDAEELGILATVDQGREDVKLPEQPDRR